MPISLGPSQCPFTKSLFWNNSYESVYDLAWLHTNLLNMVVLKMMVVVVAGAPLIPTGT